MYLVSTRFDNFTWNENKEYREKNKYKCIYGAPQEFSPKIMINSIVFVVEMNNSINKIEGIGLIRNSIHKDKYYKIYSDGNYNRYIYKSNYHVSREEILRYNPNIVNILDNILFKGKTHLKRGSGFTTIPKKLLESDICDNMNLINEIKSLFIIYHEKGDI